MAGLINNWLESAAELQSNTHEPAWLVAKRDLAVKQLIGLNEPSRKLESWRYADAGRMMHSIDSNSEVDETESAVLPKLDDDCTVIRLSEGGIELLHDCPQWLTVEGIEELQQHEWQDLPFNQETVVNLANTMLFNAGVSIKVAAHEQTHSATDQRHRVVVEYYFKNNENWQYVRNQFCLAADSQISIEERFVSGRVNVVNLYQVSSLSKLQRAQNVYLSEFDQIISFNQFDVAGRAEILNMNQHHGGSLQHHLHRINFQDTASKYTSGAVNKSYDNNNISDLVEVNHHHQNNQSDVTHRSIAKDRSQIFNNAKAFVAVGADQSEIEQDLKNILLSPDAKIFSKPELEVYADEVVAAHGSTIGALDDQSLFYLQSRGIDIEQAREIMIESFEQEAHVC